MRKRVEETKFIELWGNLKFSIPQIAQRLKMAPKNLLAVAHRLKLRSATARILARFIEHFELKVSPGEKGRIIQYFKDNRGKYYYSIPFHVFCYFRHVKKEPIEYRDFKKFAVKSGYGLHRQGTRTQIKRDVMKYFEKWIVSRTSQDLMLDTFENLIQTNAILLSSAHQKRIKKIIKKCSWTGTARVALARVLFCYLKSVGTPISQDGIASMLNTNAESIRKGVEVTLKKIGEELDQSPTVETVKDEARNVDLELKILRVIARRGGASLKTIRSEVNAKYETLKLHIEKLRAKGFIQRTEFGRFRPFVLGKNLPANILVKLPKPVSNPAKSSQQRKTGAGKGSGEQIVSSMRLYFENNKSVFEGEK